MPQKRHYDDVESWIKKLFLERLFKPVVASIRSAWLSKKPNLLNSKRDESALIRAIETGQITVSKSGIVKGATSSSIVKGLRAFGAKRNYSNSEWYFYAIPEEVAMATDLFQKLKFRAEEAAIKALEDALLSIEIEADKSEGVKQATIKAAHDFDSHAKNAIGINFPDLSPAAKSDIEKSYKKNLSRYIKSMGRTQVEKLRSNIQKWVIDENMRADDIADEIKDIKGETDRHAEFLAQQETNLFLSAYQTARYLDVGVNRYVWITRDDSSVRETHKELHGRVFDFRKPPITSVDGRRNNPGEDFRCRCLASPILETEATIKIKTGDKSPASWIR